MSVTIALQALRTQLLTITTPQSPKKVYADPKEATSLGEFPCIVLSLAPAVAHGWGFEAMNGVAKHDYTIAIWVFLGMRGTPIGELHSRTLEWPEAVFRVLAQAVTLGGAVNQIGDGTSPQLFTYQIGPLEWGEQVLWGVKILLPVVEKPYDVVMSP